MSLIYPSNAETIGKTPLVLLRNTPEGFTGKIWAKTESRNPAFSVKCRVGANLIWDAEKKGLIKPHTVIVEPTSGNTGIALAFVAAAKGYKLILTMPETMSIERRKVLAALGAEIVLTSGPEGMAGAVRRAEEIAQSNPEKYFIPQQFSNPANPEIHEKTTGPEIWNDTEGQIDILISGVGTGGTISGVSKYIKKTRGKAIESIAVEPKESPVITQHLNGEEIKPSPHKIQGIGAGFIPGNLDLSLVDSVVQISSEEAMEYTKTLARTEGILAGISSGAALAAALKVASLEVNKNKNIVVILPDLGERYLSTPVFD